MNFLRDLKVFFSLKPKKKKIDWRIVSRTSYLRTRLAPGHRVCSPGIGIRQKLGEKGKFHLSRTKFEPNNNPSRLKPDRLII